MEKNNYYTTMRKNILTSMILVPLIIFAIVLFIGFYYFKAAIKSNTVASMVRIVEDHNHMIESFLMERKTDLEFILNSYTFNQVNTPAHLTQIFNTLQKKSDAFVDLGVFNEQGLHVAYQGPYELTGKNYYNTEWFKEVMKKGYYISDIFLGFRQVPHFVIAIVKQEYDTRWVIRATIDTYLFNNIVKQVHIGKTGEAYILNTQGIYQTEPRANGSLMEKDPEFDKFPETDKGIKVFIKSDVNSDKYLYAITWMKENKWLLVVKQEKNDAFKALRTASYLIVLITLIGGFCIVLIALYVTEYIIRRLKRVDEEKGHLKEQLIGASRLAELGEMAAGFAHEINNPLQIIKSEQALVDMVISDLKDQGALKDTEEEFKELEDSMKQINLQLNRCAKITQAILKFGRQSSPSPQNVNLSEFIPEIIDMVRKKANVHGMKIEQDIDPNTPMIFGDTAQFQQVLLNLLNNAIDAIFDRHGADGGYLAIKAENSDSGTVRILVSDNGSGISPENVKKIFSPFFTTKPVGKGTGLGLSVCYGIIDSMGGKMEVNSEQGIGTTFAIYLPASK